MKTSTSTKKEKTAIFLNILKETYEIARPDEESYRSLFGSERRLPQSPFEEGVSIELSVFPPCHLASDISWFSLKDFEIFHTIAQGSYGNVKLARWKSREMNVAVKFLNDEFSGVNLSERVCAAISSLSHPNLVNIYGILTDGEHHGIVMEFLPRSLSQALGIPQASSPQIPLSWQERCRIALDITRGLAALHTPDEARGSHIILHRDLRAANILLTDEGIAKISDVGFVVQRTQFHNTHAWTAPEIIDKDDAYDTRAEIYSLGMLLWEIAACREPFSEIKRKYKGNFVQMDGAILNAIKRGEREKIPDHVPSLWKNLVIRCWAQNPDERPCLTEVNDELQKLADFLTEGH